MVNVKLNGNYSITILEKASACVHAGDCARGACMWVDGEGMLRFSNKRHTTRVVNFQEVIQDPLE